MNIGFFIEEDFGGIIFSEEREENNEEDECNPSKCKSCIHKGFCDLADEYEYENSYY